MDLETAREHRGKLQMELEAISNGATTLSLVPRLVTMEVRRLDEDIARESLRSSTDHREGDSWVNDAGVSTMFRVSNEFGLNDHASEEGFLELLKAELDAINNFHHPLPLTSQFIQMVVDHMEEQIATKTRRWRLFESLYHSSPDSQQEGTGEGSSSSAAAAAAAAAARKPAPVQHTRFWRENLHHGITDAINTASQQNPQGATFDQVLDILRQNPSIQFDDNVRTIAFERYLGAVYFPDTPVDQSKCGQQ